MNMGAKQYGLIMPKKAQLSAPKAGNIFEDDNESDTEDGVDWVRKSLKAESDKNRVKRQTKLDIQRALNDDPTIYQYDEIYDEIEKNEAQSKSIEKKEKQKPKYIHNLLKAADRRKREQEQRVERMVQKEREAEGEMFANKESFVTSAYKAKLEEFKKMEEEEERMDRLEAIGDVTKQQDMSGFYRQLFAQTVDAPTDITFDGELDLEAVSQSSNAEDNDDDDDNASSATKSNSDVDSDSDHHDEGRSRRDSIPRIISKAKKPRQYRQRVIEASDVESEPEDNHDELHPEEPSASNDIKINVEHESPRKKTKISTDENELNDINNGAIHESKLQEFEIPANKSPIKKENDNETNIIVEKREPRDKKVSIWEKRTVGPVFEAALQRYYNRKAIRISGC